MASGKIVADSLFYEHEYDNLISGKLKADSFTGGYSTTQMGVQMNKRTKTIGCTALKTLVEDNYIKIVDFTTIQELSSFIKDNNTYKAEKGKHDDLVMPLVLFGWFTTQTFFENLSVFGMSDLIKERKEQEAESSHMAFGFYTDHTYDALESLF